MSEPLLLINVAVALAYALAGGLLARRVGLPTIVGYIAAGVAIGRFTPGFQGDEGAIQQLAEVGVILLMFGVGLHFSFRDLWEVRRVAIPGALVQMAVISALGAAVGHAWGFSPGGSWVLGIALSVASTVVMMRALTDEGWLATPHGKVAAGWLIVEDLLTVALLVLLPVVTAQTADGWGQISLTLAIALGKAGLFIGLMVVVGQRVLPFVLDRVVHTRSRELFVLAALTVALGIALVSSSVFQVSLALGAFVAGVVVSDSPFSHQIGADLLPFREAFAVIFFVSIGMLVDPVYVMEHWAQVAVLTFIVVVVKGLVSGALGAVLPGPGRTALVLAAGRSQIGEFSFIVGQAGIALGLIDTNQYSLILASAIVSITLNAFIFRLVDPVERALKRRPALWRALQRGELQLRPDTDAIRDHVVIVGCGRVGRHIAEALGRLKIPRLVVEADPSRRGKLAELGVPVLYGDAGSSEVLDHAGLDRAKALVITIPDDAAALSVAITARRVAPDLRIVSRASTWEGARRLKAAGANDVVRPELEGGVEIVRRTLLDIGLPIAEVQRYADLIRREGLDGSERPNAEGTRMLDELLNASNQLEMVWLDVPPESPAVGRTLGSLALRARTGASVVAIIREGSVLANPGQDTAFAAGDRVAVIGAAGQIDQVGTELRGPHGGGQGAAG